MHRKGHLPALFKDMPMNLSSFVFPRIIMPLTSQNISFILSDLRVRGHYYWYFSSFLHNTEINDDRQIVTIKLTCNSI